MEEMKSSIYPKEKDKMYELVCKQMEGLLEAENHWLSGLSNASAILKAALEEVNWAGFYIMNEGSLLLGPFQGNIACVRITLGSGVCGTAAQKDEILVIENVHEFQGHIPCDCASNAEIVLPIHVNGQVVAVLDIDSPKFSRFDEEDRKGLECFVKMLESKVNFIGIKGSDKE